MNPFFIITGNNHVEAKSFPRFPSFFYHGSCFVILRWIFHHTVYSIRILYKYNKVGSSLFYIPKKRETERESLSFLSIHYPLPLKKGHSTHTQPAPSLRLALKEGRAERSCPFFPAKTWRVGDEGVVVDTPAHCAIVWLVDALWLWKKFREREREGVTPLSRWKIWATVEVADWIILRIATGRKIVSIFFSILISSWSILSRE